MSTENVVADSWEDADADPVKEIMDKMEKVKLLQRKEEKKEAFFEKVKSEENGVIPKLQAEEGCSVEEPRRVFLRRPKDGFTSETVADTSPTQTTSSENPTNSRGRSHHKNPHKEPKQPTQTLEERQAAYQAARDRILGSEYKPDNQEIKEIKFIDRSKSPETLRMTEQNMVEHYGEELSRELMQQPAEPVAATPNETPFVPDFSQPPPCLVQQDGSEVYNGPPGFQHHQPNFVPSHPQQQFIDGSFYSPMNGHIPMQYGHQQAFQQYIQQENSAMSSPSQNSNPDGQNEQHVYYNYAPQHQQTLQNCAPFNLPNMAYPPPNYNLQGQQPQKQNNQQMPSQMNYSQMMPAQQQAFNQMMPSYQMQNCVNRGGASNNGGAPVRVQNRPQLMYMPLNPPMNQQPSSMMYQNHNGQQKGNVQSYAVRNGGGNQQPPRQYPPNQQNGQFYQNQGAPNQNSQNNGRKTIKNGRNGVKNEDIPMQHHIQPSFPMNMPAGQNPIPFGCPPRHVNAIREQYAAMPPNSGAGLLGPHPMMVSTHWNGPPLPNPQSNFNQ